MIRIKSVCPAYVCKWWTPQFAPIIMMSFRVSLFDAMSQTHKSPQNNIILKKKKNEKLCLSLSRVIV